MVNKVRVTIAGAPYAIATTDTENYITTLAKKLDDDITKLPQERGQRREYAQPDTGLHFRCSQGEAGSG